MAKFLDLKDKNNETFEKIPPRYPNIFLISGIAILLTVSLGFSYNYYKKNIDEESVAELKDEEIKKESILQKTELKEETKSIVKPIKKEDDTSVLKKELELSKKKIIEHERGKEVYSTKLKEFERKQELATKNAEIRLAEKDKLSKSIAELAKKNKGLETKNLMMLEQLKIIKDKLLKTIKEKRKASEIFSKELNQRDQKLSNYSGNNLANESTISTSLKEKYEKEIELLKAEKTKKEEDLHYNLGVVYQDVGIYKKAIIEYKKALEMNPFSADIHYNLAIIYDDFIPNDKQAINHYKKYLKLSPDDDPTMVNEWIRGIENGE